MTRVRVMIPFHRSETDTLQEIGDEILVSEGELTRIRSVNVNMVAMIGEVEAEAEAEAKPKKSKKK